MRRKSLFFKHCSAERALKNIFYSDKYVNLAGWGQKLDEETNEYRTTSYLKVISLVVNARETCEEIFSVEDLRNNGIDLTTDDITKLERKLKHGFTSEVTCVGNDFEISEG